MFLAFNCFPFCSIFSWLFNSFLYSNEIFLPCQVCSCLKCCQYTKFACYSRIPTPSILYPHMCSCHQWKHCWFQLENLIDLVWEDPNFLKLFDELCNWKDIFYFWINAFAIVGYHDGHDDMPRSNLDFLILGTLMCKCPCQGSVPRLHKCILTTFVWALNWWECVWWML